MHIETPARRKHVIGLTPLIDVVFILLVFFMLATSLMDWRGIGLATGSTQADPNQPPPAVVRLAADNGLYFEGQRYALADLAKRLNAELQAGNISAAILRPDTTVTLGPTVRTLDALAGAGVQNLSLGEAENPEHPPVDP